MSLGSGNIAPFCDTPPDSPSETYAFRPRETGRPVRKQRGSFSLPFSPLSATDPLFKKAEQADGIHRFPFYRPETREPFLGKAGDAAFCQTLPNTLPSGTFDRANARAGTFPANGCSALFAVPEHQGGKSPGVEYPVGHFQQLSGGNRLHPRTRLGERIGLAGLQV